MIAKSKSKHPAAKKPAEKSSKPAAPKPAGPKPAAPKPAAQDDLYDDGDMATPKREFDEDDIKEQEDKRL